MFGPKLLHEAVHLSIFSHVMIFRKKPIYVELSSKNAKNFFWKDYKFSKNIEKIVGMKQSELANNFMKEYVILLPNHVNLTTRLMNFSNVKKLINTYMAILP